jgi:transcriptional regulator with XRE-family HTH domain
MNEDTTPNPNKPKPAALPKDLKRWPQRAVFQKAVRSYQAKTGDTHKQVANKIGLSESRLRQLLYNQGEMPKLKTIKAAANLFEISISTLVDDPAPPDGMMGQWQDASERDRVIMSLMLSDVTAGDLSEEDKNELYLAWKAEVEKIRRYKKLGG